MQGELQYNTIGAKSTLAASIMKGTRISISRQSSFRLSRQTYVMARGTSTVGIIGGVLLNIWAATVFACPTLSRSLSSYKPTIRKG